MVQLRLLLRLVVTETVPTVTADLSNQPSNAPPLFRPRLIERPGSRHTHLPPMLYIDITNFDGRVIFSSPFL